MAPTGEFTLIPVLHVVIHQSLSTADWWWMTLARSNTEE